MYITKAVGAKHYRNGEELQESRLSHKFALLERLSLRDGFNFCLGSETFRLKSNVRLDISTTTLFNECSYINWSIKLPWLQILPLSYPIIARKYTVLQQKVSFLCGKNAGDIFKLKISCVDYVTVDKLAVDNVLIFKWNTTIPSIDG